MSEKIGRKKNNNEVDCWFCGEKETVKKVGGRKTITRWIVEKETVKKVGGRKTITRYIRAMWRKETE